MVQTIFSSAYHPFSTPFLIQIYPFLVYLKNRSNDGWEVKFLFTSFMPASFISPIWIYYIVHMSVHISYIVTKWFLILRI
ncbi:hypothetical protein AQUCO_02600336v1 [Aquilegia coerulea]|uniref:Uncharacterized protein n=1 Tax=Aquilegia coerulea TaxID=218851 RepID=A0A2G5D8E9_AQUCA|nr:hypothetical protein AQUCO_02600336v1 [Aquilegia coerulea]